MASRGRVSLHSIRICFGFREPGVI
jgi:hypothetical protein